MFDCLMVIHNGLPDFNPQAKQLAAENWSRQAQSFDRKPLAQWINAANEILRLKVEDNCLSTPLEKALAQLWGWNCPDGLFPWAALAAKKIGLQGTGWALFHLTHWRVGNGQVLCELPGPISHEESEALRLSMVPYFSEDGITLHAYQPGIWLGQSELFSNLPAASLNRVLGRQIEPWLIGQQLERLRQPEKMLRRLQNEMQMLLYQHAVNHNRPRALNSFWISGTGDLLKIDQLDQANTPLKHYESLSESFWAMNPVAWVNEWFELQNLLSVEITQHHNPGLMLVGESEVRLLAVSKAPQLNQPSVWRRFKNWLAAGPKPDGLWKAMS
jgi:hypothetical protein